MPERKGYKPPETPKTLSEKIVTSAKNALEAVKGALKSDDERLMEIARDGGAARKKDGVIEFEPIAGGTVIDGLAKAAAYVLKNNVRIMAKINDTTWEMTPDKLETILQKHKPKKFTDDVFGDEAKDCVLNRDDVGTFSKIMADSAVLALKHNRDVIFAAQDFYRLTPATAQDIFKKIMAEWVV